MDMDLFEKGKEVIAKLENAGYEAYFVGGCVRDYLLQRPINDIDICTSALPQQTIALFERVILTGVKHGTVTVLIDKIPFEVTTYRTEGTYCDHRRPDQVYFVQSLKDDLERRDFTINALAMDKHFRIVDYFNGQQDLKKNVIRTVGCATERFREDALRMLRAIRFSATLNFKIYTETMLSIQSNASLINHVAIERIATEFVKLMEAPHVEKGLSYLKEGAVVEQVHPFQTHKNVFTRTNIDHIGSLNHEERWVWLFHSCSEQCMKELVEQLKLSNAFKKRLTTLLGAFRTVIQYESVEEVPEYALFKMGYDNVKQSFRLHAFANTRRTKPSSKDLLVALTAAEQSAQRRFNELPIHSEKQLAVTGAHILQTCKRHPGPWIQQLLDQLLYQVVTRQVQNDRKELLRIVKEGTE